MDNSAAERRAILPLACAAFASMASMRVCDAMLPGIAQSFAVSTGAAAQVISGYALAYGLLQVFYGYAGDRYGKLRVMAFALSTCTLGSFGAALALNLGTLVAFRIATGATAGGIIPLAIAWIGDTVPYERRQATLARFLSGTITGLVAGQLLGGLAADTVGWRWALAALALVFGVVGAFVFRQLTRFGGEPDSTASLPPHLARQVADVLRSRWTRAILAIAFLEGVIGFAPLAFVPAYLHARFGLSLTAAGAVVAAFGAGAFGYTLVARRLIARYGERGLVTRGGPVASAALLVLVLGPHWQWSLPACAIAGTGLYMVHNTLQIHATQMSPQARGMGVALFATALFLGQSAGVALGAVVLDHAGARWLFSAAALGFLAVSLTFARALRAKHLRPGAAKAVA